MSTEKYTQKYYDNIHAVQAGIKIQVAKKPEEPWEFRVGINSCFVSLDAIQTLLIDKGIITIEELAKHNADAAGKEKKRLEDELSKGGLKVALV